MLSRIAAEIRGNRRLAAGLWVMGVLVAALAARWGYGRHRAALEEMGAYREALRTSRLMVARGKGMKSRLEAEKRSMAALEKGLLRATEPSMAAAELQEAFKRLIAGKDITIRSESVLGFEEADGYTRIPVEFHIRTRLPLLARLLYEIERSPMVMGVRTMHVTVPYSNKGGEISVTLVIEGAARQGGKGT